MRIGLVCVLAALILGIAMTIGGAAPPPCSDPAELIVYSGRTRELVEPVLGEFEAKTGIRVRVRYGETAELAALLLEEGGRTPADLFFAQDAGALGALAREDRLERLPREVLERVASKFRSPRGLWVGVTGRARTLVYNTERVKPGELPGSVIDLANPRWKGRIAWAPTNGSFQAMVTAVRLQLGEEGGEEWLRGLVANGPRAYAKNSEIVRAVGAGEADVGLVNHYYLLKARAARPDLPAANHFTRPGDPGSLVNVAGVALLKKARADADARRRAEALVRWLLSEDAQRHFAAETYEYPLAEGVAAAPELTPLSQLEPPALDLSDLRDLEGTLKLLRKVGALP